MSNGKKSTTSSTASSPDLTAHAHSHPALSEASDDSSLTSEDLEEHLAGGYIDSDTGLESMSSAETAAKSCSVCQDRPTSTPGPTNDILMQEVAKLKCDKLDLLRQNVVSNISCILVIFIAKQFSLLLHYFILFDAKCYIFLFSFFLRLIQSKLF